MKEVKNYVCEYCHTQYKEKNMAEECEKSHQIPKQVVGCAYRSITTNRSGYPFKIEMEMSDGEIITYRQ